MHNGKKYFQIRNYCWIIHFLPNMLKMFVFAPNYNMANNWLTLTPSPPFSFLAYLLGKGGVKKWGFPLGFEPGTPSNHNALFTHGTSPGCRCPGSDFVPIWDPLLWRNRTWRIFFTSPCWILLDCGRLGLGNKKCYALLTLTPSPPFSFLAYLLGKGGVKKWGFPLGFELGTPRNHNALFTHGTSPGCRCPGSDFVPIWDPLLWRNRTWRIFFTSPCWILLDCGRLGLINEVDIK